MKERGRLSTAYLHIFVRLEGKVQMRSVRRSPVPVPVSCSFRIFWTGISCLGKCPRAPPFWFPECRSKSPPKLNGLEARARRSGNDHYVFWKRSMVLERVFFQASVLFFAMPSRIRSVETRSSSRLRARSSFKRRVKAHYTLIIYSGFKLVLSILKTESKNTRFNEIEYKTQRDYSVTNKMKRLRQSRWDFHVAAVGSSDLPEFR